MSLGGFEVAYPWALLLLPVSLLPFVRRGRPVLGYTWLAMIPRDLWSSIAGGLHRLLASLALVTLVMGLAQLERGETRVEHLGRGAEIVLLLDRSRSMSQGFFTPAPGQSLTGRESKARVARRMLSHFAANRTEDLFGMVMFSKLPMRVLDFTPKQEVIQAAIWAGANGRGISNTDIGLGLESAASMFDDRPYLGSRIVLLVSDGGADLDPAMRQRLTQLFKVNRVSLYWIYIRSLRSPGLLANEEIDAATAQTTPEHLLHEFFSGMGIPYRAYEAENPQALRKAIADVDRLERLPIRFSEVLPRRDLSQLCYGVALACLLLLLAASFLELRRWA